MPAAQHDILIEQGSLYTLNLVYKDSEGVPIDLTGWSARMQIRQKHTSPDPALISLSSVAGSIILGGALGTISARITSDMSAALTIKTGVYDLELIPPSGEDDAFRLIEGAVTVSKEVTRS